MSLRKRLILIATTIVLLSATSALAQGTVVLRGLVDIVGQNDYEMSYLNSNNTGDGNFDPLRARLFVEGARENTQIYLQFLFSQQSFAQVRLYGGYLLHDVFGDSRLLLQAGLLPVNNGVWASHTYSDKNPLVGIPLSYYWKSNLPSRQMPNDLDDLLAHRGQGQLGITYADSNGTRGARYATMPILYDNCWNYGLFALGTMGPINYALGATLGSPASPLNEPDVNDNITFQLKLGYAFTPGLKMWASGARGAYMSRDVSPYLPAGKSINDYFQNLVGVAVDWKWDHLWMMGEFFYNHFDTPLRAGGLDNTSFYAQAVYTMFVGWDASLRYDELRYEKVQDSTGNPLTWDNNVHRVEGGVGYRVTRDLRVKAVVQATDDGGGWTGDNVIPALQASFAF